MTNTQIPVISFFTGGGFLDLGFEVAGFKVVWSNEVNPTFADLYEFGMTSWRKASGRNDVPAKISDRRSVSEISKEEILTAAFPDGIPGFFGVIGGPPCPDFSIAGRNQGGIGRHGRLTSIFVKKICELRPAFFVFENVAGLFKTKSHRRYLERLIGRLEVAGYRIDLKIINALEVGVPQDRERLFVVGFRASLAPKYSTQNLSKGTRNWFPWPLNQKYAGAKVRFKWPVKVAKGEDVILPADVPPELTVSSVLGTNGEVGKLPNGDEYFNPYSKKFKSVLEGDTKRKSFKRLHRYRFSPTACYGNNEVHLHPWKDRRLAVREAMRIQGIPDTYILPANTWLGAKFRMISNGVPVPSGAKWLEVCPDLFKAEMDLWKKDKRSAVMARIWSIDTKPEIRGEGDSLNYYTIRNSRVRPSTSPRRN